MLATAGERVPWGLLRSEQGQLRGGASEALEGRPVPGVRALGARPSLGKCRVGD